MTFNPGTIHYLPNSQAMTRLIHLFDNVLYNMDYDYDGSYFEERISYIEVVDAAGERHLIENESYVDEIRDDWYAYRDDCYNAGLRG